MRKAVSPLMSTILVISIIFVIAGIVGPWALNFSKKEVGNTGENTENQITCQSTSYDFDSSYGNSGVEWEFPQRMLRAKVMNTGSVSLHSFSFQLYIQDSGYRFYQTKNSITPDNPLKPGQSAILEANITEDLSGQLTEVKVLNGVCSTFILTQEF